MADVSFCSDVVVHCRCFMRKKSACLLTFVFNFLCTIPNFDSLTAVVLKLFGSWATFVFQKPFAGHKN